MLEEKKKFWTYFFSFSNRLRVEDFIRKIFERGTCQFSDPLRLNCIDVTGLNLGS